MDFFAHQDKARRNTWVLLALFAAAVCCIVVIINLLVAFFLWSQQLDNDSYYEAVAFADYLTPKRFVAISLTVLLVIGCAIAFKWKQLRAGGRAVAESLGGKRIFPNSDDPDQQRVLNVVEEMAIASGMPVPPVYLLASERGINAFAAGHTTADAVIGVTTGLIEHLDRDQIQGVIAHEFSHILNGDMRLNLRLVALLAGIVFVTQAGRVLLESNSRHHHSSRNKKGGSVAMLGLGFLITGSIGTIFANLIKASISRQREYLADASAVQFTRNPDGIAGALKVIGGYSFGSTLAAARASETSHMFISNALGKFASFDTHPPLDDRIRRIQPRWDGRFTPTPLKPRDDTERTTVAETANVLLKHNDLATTVATVAALGEMDKAVPAKPAALPPAWQQWAHDPAGGAINLVYALLFSHNPDIKQQQLQLLIAAEQCDQADPLLLAMLAQRDKLDAAHRLPLLALSVPALKAMSPRQYQRFRANIRLLIDADQQCDLFEWCMLSLLNHYLEAEFAPSETVVAATPSEATIGAGFQVVLSALVYYGETEEAKRAAAFGRGCNTAGLYTLSLLSPEQLSLPAFMRAVDRLARAKPLLKNRMLRGLIKGALVDQHLSTTEREMLQAIAAAMDCPLPTL